MQETASISARAKGALDGSPSTGERSGAVGSSRPARHGPTRRSSRSSRRSARALPVG
jgi:hypothetical protein